MFIKSGIINKIIKQGSFYKMDLNSPHDFNKQELFEQFITNPFVFYDLPFDTIMQYLDYCNEIIIIITTYEINCQIDKLCKLKKIISFFIHPVHAYTLTFTHNHKFH